MCLSVKLLLELSMECEPLSRSEAISVCKTLGTTARPVLEGPGVLVLETDADPGEFVGRVALCHSVSEYLGSCGPDELESMASGIDVPGPIRVHSTRIGTSHTDVDLDGVNRKIGDILGRGRGVDIHSPRSEVRIVYSEDVHIGRLLGTVDRAAFEARKTRNMPFDHPVSIHPKFARCLVNLTETRSGGRLLDPFCGTGAIVAETALCGFDAIGADVSDRMLEGARSNLSALGLKASLHLTDVGSLRDRVQHIDGIATDPPYGRSSSTNGEAVAELMRRSFAAFSQIMDRGSRVAMAVHDPELVSLAEGFRLMGRHDLWVHRSLTRHFCLLERL